MATLAQRLEGRRAPKTIGNYKAAMRQYVAMVEAWNRAQRP